LGATAIAGPAIFERTIARAATSKVIKIGHVSSPTGVFAPVAQADPFILDQIRTALAKGITNGGVSYKVQIINEDSQSKTNRASAVAAGKEPGRTGFRFWRRLWQQTTLQLSGRSSGRVNRLRMSAKHLWLLANGERETTDLNLLFVRIPALQTLKLRTS
jgi:hypothetical protein